MTRVITIDGPSGSGKGTLAGEVAQRLGWHCLDSGALYRLVGLSVKNAGISFENVAKVVEIAGSLDAGFEQGRVFLAGQDVTDEIRTERAGNNASKVAAIPEVRSALLQWQRDYARAPGLVADGRDMGSVVFPSAGLKIFLDASPLERAKRRHKQLIEKGLDVNLRSLVAEIEERDARDRNRSVAPLMAPEGAMVLESTDLSIEEVLEKVLEQVRCTFPDLVV